MNGLDQKLTAYLEILVSEILAQPSLQGLTEEKKKEYAEKLRLHFSDLIVETLLNRLEEDKLAEIKNLTKKPEELEAKLQEYAATVPDLAEDIEERLKRESKALKQNLQLPQA